MAKDTDDILKFVRTRSSHPMKIKEIASEMGIDETTYGSFRRRVKRLIADGDLVRLKRGRIGPADQMDIVVGAISINRAGTGFVVREGKEDLLIPSSELHTALDGDKVMVRLGGKRFGREAGTVIRVVERGARNIVGLFQKQDGLMRVHPDNPRLHRDIYISSGDSNRARHGEKVVAELTLWDDPHLSPQGRVKERLGFPDRPGVDMLSIARSHNLPDKFPSNISSEAEQAAAVNIDAERKRRLDLTGDCVYTIDPADAKDHDDAVSVVRLKGGYRLGVHIADVSFFVKEGTALDTEAFERGNSVYLPGMVLPMLPEVLSNDVCSLRPDRVRLAHSAIIDFDEMGKMLSWKVADTVIRSQAKLSYEDVQNFFDGNDLPPKYKGVATNLEDARQLAQLLSKRRADEGSLDFDLPEAKIILNKDGEVVELGHRVRLESHRLVEEFMLAANRAVALEIFRKGEPLLYRVHDKPDSEKLQAFSDMMKRLGLSFPVSKNIRPLQFARFLKQVKDIKEADFINELMLRSMQKAVYQRENIGHFGLAFTHYAHFTSPIRRYPDLLMHRLLRKVRPGKYPVPFARRIPSVIDNVGRHCSETERKAEAAEREAVRAKQVTFMANRIGEEFDGVISGTTGFGFFVRLNNLGVEGLVRISTIDDDYYHYDESNFRIVGRRSGRTFRMGDTIRVGIAKVDSDRNEIDLSLPQPPEPTAASKKKAKGRVTRPKAKRR